MTLWQGDSKRKGSGGRKIHARKKRRFELGSDFQPTVVDKTESKKGYEGMGGKKKFKVSRASSANVLDPKTGNHKKVKILSVRENPSDSHFVQRNILTKGSTIQTDLGLAKVTSRPGRDGVVNAVLIEGDK
jgi:small subunit ribosomal protein S8e